MNKIFLFTFLIVFILVSCRKSDDVKKRDILSDEVFYELLKDIHKADGIISASGIRNKNFKSDSVSLYNYVLKKHDVSRTQFSKTVQYYSIHTEKYLVFYDSLNSYFKNLENENREALKLDVENVNNLKEAKDSTNLWNLKDEWNLPEDGETNPIAFKLETEKQGTYTLKASIKIFPDDKSINQRMTIIANYDDGTKDLNSVGTMVKDEKFDTYDVSISTDKNKELKTISGWVSDHSKNTKDKHMHIKNIELKFIEDEKDNILQEKKLINIK